jgi:hypothetical protein
MQATAHGDNIAMLEHPLKTTIQTPGHTRAREDDSVMPETCTREFEEVSPIIHAFRRMVRAHELSISEMAITAYLRVRCVLQDAITDMSTITSTTVTSTASH